MDKQKMDFSGANLIDDDVNNNNNNSSLPSPVSRANNSVSAENERGGGDVEDYDSDDGVLSADNNNEEETERIVARSKICEKAYLTHAEALQNLFTTNWGTAATADFLTNWKNEDIAGLLTHLSKSSMDREGARKISLHFRNTCVEEIMECFERCKAFNKEAGNERFRLEEIDKPEMEESPSGENTNSIRYRQKWSALFERMKKSRGIQELSSSVVGSFFKECAESCSETEQKEGPNYARIYEHLADFARGYAVKNMSKVDRLVLKTVFEELEQEIETTPSMTRFLRKVFRDAQNMSSEDFKFHEELREENYGELMNVLKFPADKIHYS